MAQKSAQPAGTVEHIPSSEHGRAFPPFDAQTFASQLFWFALAFIALYLLMSRVALPRVGSILEARRQRIELRLRRCDRRVRCEPPDQRESAKVARASDVHREPDVDPLLHIARRRREHAQRLRSTSGRQDR